MASFNMWFSVHTVNKLWACQKGYGIEFCGALNGLHEMRMKALRTPNYRCIPHINIIQC